MPITSASRVNLASGSTSKVKVVFQYPQVEFYLEKPPASHAGGVGITLHHATWSQSLGSKNDSYIDWIPVADYWFTPDETIQKEGIKLKFSYNGTEITQSNPVTLKSAQQYTIDIEFVGSSSGPLTGKTKISFDVKAGGTVTSSTPVVSGGKQPYSLISNMTNSTYGSISLSADGYLTYTETTALSVPEVSSFSCLVTDANSDGPVSVSGHCNIYVPLNADNNQGFVMSVSSTVTSSGQPLINGGTPPYTVSKSNALYGTVSVNEDGTVTYTLNANKKIPTADKYVVENLKLTVKDSAAKPATCVLNIGVLLFNLSNMKTYYFPPNEIQQWSPTGTQVKFGSNVYNLKIDWGIDYGYPVNVMILAIASPDDTGKLTYQYPTVYLDEKPSKKGKYSSGKSSYSNQDQIVPNITFNSMINNNIKISVCNNLGFISGAWIPLVLTKAVKPKDINIRKVYPAVDVSKTIYLDLAKLIPPKYAPPYNIHNKKIIDSIISNVKIFGPGNVDLSFELLANSSGVSTITFNIGTKKKPVNVIITIETYKPWINPKFANKPFFGDTLAESKESLLSKANYHDQFITFGSMADFEAGPKNGYGSKYIFENRHWAPIQVGVKGVFTYSPSNGTWPPGAMTHYKIAALTKLMTNMSSFGYKVPAGFVAYTFPGSTSASAIQTYFSSASSVSAGYIVIKALAEQASNYPENPISFMLTPDGLGHIYKGGFAESISFDNKTAVALAFGGNVPSYLSFAKDSAGLADYIKTINAIIRKLSPNSPIGYIMSSWEYIPSKAGGSNWIHNATSEKIDSEAFDVANFLKTYVHYDNTKVLSENEINYSPDFLIISQYGENNLNTASSPGGFTLNIQDSMNFFAYLEELNSPGNLNRYPILLWQAPGGHIFTNSVNKTINNNKLTSVSLNSSTLPNFLFGTKLQARFIPKIQANSSLIEMAGITTFQQLKSNLENANYYYATLKPDSKSYNYDSRTMYSMVSNMLRYIKQPYSTPGEEQSNDGSKPINDEGPGLSDWTGTNYPNYPNESNMTVIMNKCNIFSIMWGAGTGAGGFVPINGAAAGQFSTDDLGWLNNTVYNYYMSLK